MSDIKPISPSEIITNLDKIIPSVVITAVNNLLTKNFRGGNVKILQSDIIKEIIRLDDTITENKIYDNKWLDFETIYSNYGWNVSYDKPAYNESYATTFEFKPKLSIVK